jgi:hypothetical protein
MKKLLLYSALFFAVTILFSVAIASNNQVNVKTQKFITLKLSTPIQIPDSPNVSAQVSKVNADAVKFGLDRVTFLGSIIYEDLPQGKRGHIKWHSIKMSETGKNAVSEELVFPLSSTFRTKVELINVNEQIRAIGNIASLEEALQSLALKEKKPIEVTTAAKDAGTFTAEGGGADSLSKKDSSDDQGSNPFEFQEPKKEEKPAEVNFTQETDFCGKREIDLESMTAYPLFSQTTYENGKEIVKTNCTPDYSKGVPIQQKVCGYIHDFKTGLSTEQVQYYYTEPLYNNQEITAGACRTTDKQYQQYFTDQGCIDDTSTENIRIEYTRRAIDTDEEGQVICDDCSKHATFKTRVDICEDRIIDYQRLQALEEDKTIVTRRNERIPESPFLPFSDSGCSLNGNFVELKIEEKGYAHHLSDDPEVPGYSKRTVQYYYIEPNQNNKRFNIGDTVPIGPDLEHYVTRNTCPVTQVGIYIIPNYRKAFENRFEQEDYATHCYPHSDQILVQKEYGDPKFEHDFTAHRSYYITRTFFIDPVTEEKEILTPFQRDEGYSMAHEYETTEWVHDDVALQSVQKVETFITEKDGTRVKIEEAHDHATIPYDFLGETEERLVFRDSQTWTVPGPINQLKEIILVGGGGTGGDFTWTAYTNNNNGVTVNYEAAKGGSRGEFKTISGPIAVIPGSVLNLKIGGKGTSSLSKSGFQAAYFNVIAPTITTITGSFNGGDLTYTAQSGGIGNTGASGQPGYVLSNDHLGVGKGGSTTTPGASSGTAETDSGHWGLTQHQRYFVWGFSGLGGTSSVSNDSENGGILIAFETTKYERPDGTFYYVSE